jgi:HTH-type transcriptional regulator / antitoxin HigA
MSSTHHDLQDWLSPPGETIADLLDERELSQVIASQRLGVSAKHLNRVIHGAAPISAELALALERVFGPAAEFWLAREGQFQAARMRAVQRKEFESHLDWATSFPVAELKRRGWIDESASGGLLVDGLLRFFGIASPAQFAAPSAAYRMSQRFTSDSGAVACWLREGELRAAEIACAPYDQTKFRSALKKARTLTRRDPVDWFPALSDVCADAGVAVVVVAAYDGAKINGAARWLTPEKGLIQLSIRHKWEDIFWFTFFHEAGHIINDRKKDVFIELDGQTAAPGSEEESREQRADRFAARTLIPAEYDEEIQKLGLPQIASFSQRIGVSPAIVAGRLKHEGLLPWSHGNNLRRRLELVDGD